MIDTDKYEGHSAGKWRVRTRKGTFTVKDCLGDEVAAVNDYADARLIADAPLLLDFIVWVKNTHPHYYHKLTKAYQSTKNNR